MHLNLGYLYSLVYSGSANESVPAGHGVEFQKYLEYIQSI